MKHYVISTVLAYYDCLYTLQLFMDNGPVGNQRWPEYQSLQKGTSTCYSYFGPPSADMESRLTLPFWTFADFIKWGRVVQYLLRTKHCCSAVPPPPPADGDGDSGCRLLRTALRRPSAILCGSTITSHGAPVVLTVHTVHRWIRCAHGTWQAVHRAGSAWGRHWPVLRPAPAAGGRPVGRHQTSPPSLRSAGQVGSADPADPAARPRARSTSKSSLTATLMIPLLCPPAPATDSKNKNGRAKDQVSIWSRAARWRVGF